MANRRYSQFPASSDRSIVMIQGQVDIAANASIALSDVLGATVTHPGTGTYLVTFQDSFPKALACNVSFICSTTQALDVKVQQWQDTTGAATSTRTNVKSVVIQVCNASTGAPTDPTAVCSLSIACLLKNTTVRN